jgi:hypothetical protein
MRRSADCASIIPDEHAGAFGAGHMCRWADDRTLHVYFGAYAGPGMLAAGGLVRLRAGALRSADGTSAPCLCRCEDYSLSYWSYGVLCGGLNIRWPKLLRLQRPGRAPAAARGPRRGARGPRTGRRLRRPRTGRLGLAQQRRPAAGRRLGAGRRRGGARRGGGGGSPRGGGRGGGGAGGADRADRGRERLDGPRGGVHRHRHSDQLARPGRLREQGHGPGRVPGAAPRHRGAGRPHAPRRRPALPRGPRRARELRAPAHGRRPAGRRRLPVVEHGINGGAARPGGGLGRRELGAGPSINYSLPCDCTV